jgi:hypothetical protein
MDYGKIQQKMKALPWKHNSASFGIVVERKKVCNVYTSSAILTA